MLTPADAVALASRVLGTRYPDADFGFAAGSIIRGEATAGSDVDLVVMFPALSAARRESFISEGTPVDAFLHDRETLAWAFRDEVRLGRCAMTNMVAEGCLCGSRQAGGVALQRRARRRLSHGPPPLDAERRDLLRYHVTDRIDDLRDPRPPEQLAALGAQLYDPIAELLLRGAGAWAGNGKWIPRRLRALDPDLADRFVAAFDSLHVERDPSPLIVLAERALAPHGGWLFDGYRSAWPANRRIKARRARHA
jgi:hypothetical protein